MKSGKVHHEEEEEEDEEFGTRKDTNSSAHNTKDGKNSDKANATRSKHSVTEQRRRSKINERFQMLRELVPDGDQKRDTASFLLEVIQYVQFLHEKLKKYEGSYQPRNVEPTKLMPWRNSHWHAQSHIGQALAMKNGSGSTIPGPFADNNVTAPSTMQSPIELGPTWDSSGRAMDLQTEHANKAMDVQSTEYPTMNQEEHTIEGGTISISNAYSHGFLNSLTKALERTGVDLSEARISVQINLGKRASRESSSGVSNAAKDHENPMASGDQSLGHFRDTEDVDRAQKKLKI